MIAAEESELRSKLDTYVRRVEDNIDSEPGSFLVASAATHAGLYTVLLGRLAEAIEWFEMAADHHRRRAHRTIERADSASDLRSVPAPMGAALRMAILSGAHDLQRDVATDALEISRTYPYVVEHTGEEVTVEIDADRYHHLKTVAGLAVGDDQLTRIHLDGLVTALEANDALEAHQQRFAAVARVADGLLEADVGEIDAGLDELLAHHREHTVRGDIPEIDDEAICVEATALVILVRRRGQSPAFESGFIPGSLLDAVS